MDKDVRGDLSGLKKTEAASKVGETLAKRLGQKGVKSAVFDRNGYRYHGRVAAVATGAREAGLEF
jgi:large subunit ribosomal protein L18